MQEIIHFQSHARGAIPTSVGSRKIKSRGIEYDSLRVSVPGDDTRDIAWKQSSKSETLYTKSREESSTIDIVLIRDADTSWNFAPREHDDKSRWYTRLQTATRHSAESYHHSYREYPDSRGLIEKLEQKKQKKSLIVIVTSSLDIESYTTYANIAIHNDILIVHLLHHFEVRPEKYPELLLESRLIDIPEYIGALESRKKDIANLLRHMRISVIFADTDDHPVHLLNHFFKYDFPR